MENEEQSLWKKMQGHTVVYDGKPATIEDMIELMGNLAERDKERRERMDKEYTPLDKIRLSEIEEVMNEYSGNPPAGLLVKVKWGGSYMDLPVKEVYQILKNIEEYWIKMGESNGKQTNNK